MSDPELECMAHRYLYYVLGRPVITDAEYDQLEIVARSKCAKSSPLNNPGSDLESSYSEESKALAFKLLSTGPDR